MYLGVQTCIRGVALHPLHVIGLQLSGKIVDLLHYLLDLLARIVG